MNLKHAGGSHTAADTHGDHTVTAPAAAQLLNQGGAQLRAGTSERMTERNRSAVDVDFVLVKV
ncbi:hypothetical protein D1872_313590 [compost metagenome]